ncbi:hypothetical protein H6P81_011366 [Aristolochia fimbriata]|uniref:Recombination activating protein 1 n=1 Tax=Aristolochia fimbriata TaxID=158543 RepID=A0AAV7ESE8_ARIFI|nr:hypothetical protein H6P81_011366 [Aristolochia fimbriata]
MVEHELDMISCLKSDCFSACIDLCKPLTKAKEITLLEGKCTYKAFVALKEKKEKESSRRRKKGKTAIDEEDDTESIEKESKKILLRQPETRMVPDLQWRKVQCPRCALKWKTKNCLSMPGDLAQKQGDDLNHGPGNQSEVKKALTASDPGSLSPSYQCKEVLRPTNTGEESGLKLIWFKHSQWKTMSTSLLLTDSQTENTFVVEETGELGDAPQ